VSHMPPKLTTTTTIPAAPGFFVAEYD